MNNIWQQKEFKTVSAILVLILLIFAYREFSRFQNVSKLNSEVKKLEQNIESKDTELASITEERNNLLDELGTTLEKYEETKEKTDKLNDDVELISKLVNTDEELLQKYSKVYFLNEHYSPTKISAIDNHWWVNLEKLIDVHSEVKNHLEDLLEDAEDDGIDLRVLSGYRSFDTQASLKYNYLVTYGSGANTFSADQGYSEHQLGTTVDFTTPSLGSSLTTSFDQTEAFKWLENNAYKYGFVMSYPKGNAYYQYEPWHWRFVSRDLAKYLHREDLNFYDVEARDTRQYLIDFFD